MLGKTFQQYVASMRKAGEYGDHLMIYAASIYTKFKIEIVSSTPSLSNYTVLPPDGHTEATIIIGHIALSFCGAIVSKQFDIDI